MRVTSKGQITIPRRVRDDLGIRAKSEVDFVRQKDGSYRLVHLDGKPGPQSGFAPYKARQQTK